MRRYLVLLFLFLALSPVCAQDPLNYRHKDIFRALKKYDCPRKPQLTLFPVINPMDGKEYPNGKYFRVADNRCDTLARYVFVGRVNTCHSGGCAVHYGEYGGINFEYFDYFILFDPIGDVLDVQVFRYEATHGWEITEKKWLDQFRHYNGKSDLAVGKDIDGITGATTSVFSITYDVQERTKRLKKVLESILVAPL